MSEHKSGVNISLREIYDTMQEIRNEVKGIGPILSQVEKDAQKGAQAYTMAEKALNLAEKHEDGLKWLWRTVGAAFLTALVGAIILYIQLGIMTNLQHTIDSHTVIKEEIRNE